MAKERLKSPRARLFVALDLPGAVRSGIDAWGDEALRDPALRRLAPESLHVTLVFLGYLPEREVERLAAIVAEIEGPAPAIELRDPVQRPGEAGHASSRSRPSPRPRSSCRRSCGRGWSRHGSTGRRSARSGRT